MTQSPLIRYIQSILHYPHLFAYLCKIKAPTQRLYFVKNIFFVYFWRCLRNLCLCWITSQVFLEQKALYQFISSPNYNHTSWLNVTKIAAGDYIFIFQKSMYVATRANTAHKSNHARKNTSLIATRAFDLWSLRTLLF